MASERESDYPIPAPPLDRALLQLRSAQAALHQARRILGPEHPATQDLDAALLLIRVTLDDLVGAGA